MNCKWCEKPLSDVQKYNFIIGKTSGNSCSMSCSQKIRFYGTKENFDKITKSKCVVCGNVFNRRIEAGGVVCSVSCQGKLSSKRMKVQNPMFKEEYRKKASEKLKQIKHKTIIQGGNGRKATLHQINLYNEIIEHDNSFQMEYIELTGHLRFEFKSPRHYKIDIASKIHKIAIEIDGASHNTLKTKECDRRKEQLLSLKGWKVLRFTNSQIDKELKNCVQTVLSMI